MKNKIAVKLAALAMFAAVSANAATWYWTGEGGDLNWFTPANWNSAADGTGDAATELSSGDSFTFGSAIASATAINYDPSVDDFAIGTITFASGCGAVTVSGADVNKVTQIVNESGVVQTFANDVYFASTLNVRTSASATTGDPMVLFNGEKGAFGTKFAYHNYYRGKNTVDAWTLTDTPTYPVIVDGAIVTVKGRLQYNAEGIMGAASTKPYRISIGHGAKLTVNGLAFYWTQYGAGTDNSLVLFSKNNGIAIFRGGLQAKCSASTKDGYAYIDCYEGRSGSTGIVATTSLEFNAAQKGANGHRFHITVPEIVMLPGYQNKVTTSYGRMAYPGSLTWKVAEGDVTFNGYYSTKTDHSSFYICPFTFNTTDAFDGTTPRTITVSGKITGVTAAAVTRAVALSAAGCGTNAYTCAFDNFTGGFTAKDTVTVSLGSGARPGNGAVTMKGGTTLAVASSVTTAAIGGSGAVTLESGSALAFNFSSTNAAPVLAFNSGATLSLPAAGEEPVKVKVSANDGLDFNFGTEYAITSGGKFPAGAVSSGKVVLTDDSPAWAILYVNDTGDLAVKVAEYFYIKIAGSSSGNLEVPLEWIYGNTATDEESSLSEVSTALSSPGANGIPVWQSYCMGLDPRVAGNAVFCAAAAEQPEEAGKVAIEIPRSSVPDGLSGVAVTAYLDVKTPGLDWTIDTTGEKISSGAISRIATVDSPGISFFE